MNNYQLKINNLATIINNPAVDKQVCEINEVINALNQHKILNNRPIKLGLEPDELEQLKLGTDSKKAHAIDVLNNLLNNFRSFTSRSYGLWSLPNLQTAQLIKQIYEINTGLEIMAGNAYWSKTLMTAGIKMKATDSFNWAKSSNTGKVAFYPTEGLDAVKAIQKYKNSDLIICSWAPNFGDADYQVLNAYRKYCSYKTTLLFVGEKDGATNTPIFWQEARIVHNEGLRKIKKSFQSFDFINEEIFEIK